MKKDSFGTLFEIWTIKAANDSTISIFFTVFCWLEIFEY